MKQRLLKILEQFKNKKILVIGDIMLDKYIWGDVSRISPEAPVQVVNVMRETYEAGGAANVANNVSALTGNAFMAGIAGNDEAKRILLDELSKKGIDTGGIFLDKDKPTTQKVRIIGKSQQLLRVDYEKKEHVHKDIEGKMISFLDKIIKQVDVIVVSDYAKGVITKAVIVDPKPKHKDLYANVTLVTPNNAEASEMTGIEDGDESVLEMGSKLLKYLNANVLVTRGEKGMSLFEKDGITTHIPAKAKEVYSIIGAGDTVVATIALALASGADLKEAATLANIAAGIKVGKIGTASVSIEEIKREIEGL
ncbi:bifunctional hydroxymethylpyrimidine kinase/phosphomethylpyrimidine kinase [Candidatus Woesearchaeota archaeon]|nr:bifunctional hydroxymethylpyrimidine kinase/phosphomethylpyrimidine kinase [Candidatus Woesearchaeota archaeon]